MLGMLTIITLLQLPLPLLLLLLTSTEGKLEMQQLFASPAQVFGFTLCWHFFTSNTLC